MFHFIINSALSFLLPSLPSSVFPPSYLRPPRLQTCAAAAVATAVKEPKSNDDRSRQMGFSDGTFTRALTAAAVGSRSPVMQSVREGSGDATLQTILFIFLPSIHIRHRIGCGVVNIWQRLCTAQKGEMPRRWKEQGSKEKTAFRLSSYSAVKPQAAKCIFIVVVRKSDCAPGKSGVISNAIAIYAEPSDGRVLAELRLMAGDDDEPRKDVLFYTSELRTEWNPPAMENVEDMRAMMRSYIRHQC